MPFTYALNPIIFSIGWFSLRWYSLVYVAGFLFAYWLLLRFARRGVIKHLDAEGAEEYLVWLIIGSIVGARLFEVLVFNPAYYFANPWKVFAVWEGGMAFHGGLLGAVLVTAWFCKRRKVSFYELGDLLVIPLSLALVFGRIANFVNAELVGRVTDVSWCVNYPARLGIEGCRHPSQFYESAQNLITFAILLPIYLKGTLKKKLREGTVFWLFILLYGIGRIITNFWRAPDAGDVLIDGLLLGQWLSVGMAALGAVMLSVRGVRPAKKR
jgi:phosphatidylglycerol---prolipoprotein diacylglyceryl transferase